MKKILVILLLSASTTLANGRREAFPSDYTPHPCAPANACDPIPQWQVIDTAALKGFDIDSAWLDANWHRMIDLARPACAKLATCFAMEGNLSIFCVDLLRPEMIGICERFPKESRDYAQCGMFMRIFAIGIDLRDKEIWKTAQQCAATRTARTTPGTMEVWIEPADFAAASYKGSFRVHAIDTETRVPVMGLVSMPDTALRAGAPGGKPYTAYDIKWAPKFVRVPNGEGHTDLVAPKITVTAKGYAPVIVDVPLTPGEVIVEMTPPVTQLRRGKNQVIVTARDASTNEPVELRVFLGETILGDTNEPLEIEIKKGQKRPEIWVTSLFDRYDDVVVAPAEK